MALENRTAKCDLCGHLEQEKILHAGWKGWAIIDGIGSEPPSPQKPVTPANTQFYLCPNCKEDVAQYLKKRKFELGI